MTELDRIDLKMLRLLQNNGRLANAELAQKVGVSAATCHRRTQRLFEQGFIDRVRAMVTPRKVGSVWSSINIKRAQALINEGRMQPAGLEAYLARKANKSGIYSYEQRSANLEAPYEQLLKENVAAWEFFQAQPASYRKVVSWWIVSAKKEETRLRRLEKLMAHSASAERLPEFTKWKPARH